ncbi:fluoride efflux transporter CrcB [Alkalihalobacillus sp. CinArs1]|uniref:fluoride efflux transporter CrcB n=1 Tax=Alkalihalobacillus sp. CinArs1 TaxID=2995314 RepID=UPI0022DCE547|nr:fluoride efflux transporter CrcB [Alkalihalobacillus sp. CinArs1]
MQWLLIAVGGAAGALLRYIVTLLFNKMSFMQGFPLATLIVNLVGSFLLGVGYGSSEFGPAVSTGFLGALTTFSTFIYETIDLSSNHKYLAIIYLVISTCGGLFMAALGYILVV